MLPALDAVIGHHYPTKGQKPFINRFPSIGLNHGSRSPLWKEVPRDDGGTRKYRRQKPGPMDVKVVVCVGCEKAGGTYERLFSDRVRTNRQLTLYVHKGCRDLANKKVSAYVQSMLGK